MTNRRTLPCSLALTLLVVTSAWGQASLHQDTRTEQTQVEQSRQRTAKAWGLDQQEYRRYEAIMAGPRGIWSPNLDPLTALGLEARSEAERQKYAEQLVKTERQRVEAELAFQRAYDAAWQRLYPDDMPINAFSTKGGVDATQSIFGGNPETPLQRLNVVVALEDCARCDATVTRLLRSGTAMDIWIVDSGGDDRRIRQWAATLGIAPERVRAGDITLNHGGTLDVDPVELPRVAPRG
nr:TIGR03759 family integrating conjugative element protein [uncultured Halomonas sp.]